MAFCILLLWLPGCLLAPGMAALCEFLAYVFRIMEYCCILYFLYIYIYICLIWLFPLHVACFTLLVEIKASSSPDEDPDISDEEKKLILGTKQANEQVKEIPWKLLLSKAPVWALIISHFCHNWGTFILLTWMPTYYFQVTRMEERSVYRWL